MIAEAKPIVWTVAETLPSGRRIMRSPAGFAVQTPAARWTICPTLADARRVALGVVDIMDCVEMLQRANRHGKVDPTTGATSAQIVQVWREMTFALLAKAEAAFSEEEEPE